MLIVQHGLSEGQDEVSDVNEPEHLHAGTRVRVSQRVYDQAVTPREDVFDVALTSKSRKRRTRCRLLEAH